MEAPILKKEFMILFLTFSLFKYECILQTTGIMGNNRQIKKCQLRHPQDVICRNLNHFTAVKSYNVTFFCVGLGAFLDFPL